MFSTTYIWRCHCTGSRAQGGVRGDPITLKIQRSTDEDGVVFALSGRIEGERVAELVSLLDSEATEHDIVLDLREVDLVDRDAVMFLGRCVADGIRLDHCPAYIREWIQRERQGT